MLEASFSYPNPPSSNNVEVWGYVCLRKKLWMERHFLRLFWHFLYQFEYAQIFLQCTSNVPFNAIMRLYATTWQVIHPNLFDVDIILKGLVRGLMSASYILSSLDLHTFDVELDQIVTWSVHLEDTSCQWLLYSGTCLSILVVPTWSTCVSLSESDRLRCETYPY